MAASNSNRTTAEDVPQTDDTESYVEPGPVEPLLETTLKFLTKAGRSLVDHPNFKSSFCAATPSFDKFRLWAFGFNTNGCHLDQLLDENPATREVVVGLVSTFVAIVVAEFSDLCDRDTLRELKDALSQIAVDAGLPPSDDTGTEEPAGHSESISQESTSSCLVPGLEYISNALFELAPVLESTMDVILARRRNQMAVIDLAPLTIYINRIQQRYPDADSRVIERLSRGTLECYLRINSDESNFDPQQRLQHLMSPSAWTETPSVHPHEPKTEFRDSALASSSWRSPHDQQPSNDIVGERGVKRKIDALSGQIVEHPYVAALRHPPKRTSQATSVTTSSWPLPVPDTLGCGNIQLPPIPTDQNGDGFQCPICKRRQRIKSKEPWEKHVLADIKPYMCLEFNCSTGANSYKSLRHWKQHYQVSHGSVRYESCPFKCNSTTGCGGDEWYDHVSAHLREIRLMALEPFLVLPAGSSEKFESDSECGRLSPGLPMTNKSVPETGIILKEQLHTADHKMEFLQYWLSDDAEAPRTQTDRSRYEPPGRQRDEPPNQAASLQDNPPGGGRSSAMPALERDGIFPPVPPIDPQTGAYLEKLVQTVGWDTLSRQLSVIDQDKHRSTIATFNRNKPENFWISRNIDFTQWESANDSRALLLSAPPGHGTTEVCSHFIDLPKEKASQTNSSMLYFFSSTAIEAQHSTVFTHTLLHQIVCCSNVEKADSIAATFLDTLLGGHFQQPTQAFKEDDKLDSTMEKILRAPDNVLIEALVEAIKKAEIQELSIIIDGLSEDIARLVIKYSMRSTLKLKALLTINEPPKYGEILDRMTCIEYDKERQECLNYLHHDDTRYDKITKEHKGSLEWLWIHEKYQKWSSSERSSLLYIEGKPGSGKSTLAKYFRENLVGMEQNTSSSIIVKYFYTHRGTTLELTHENMLRSVLYSILKKDETFFFHFQSEFRKFRLSNDSKWPYTSLQQILLSLAHHPFAKKLYLILDAMDESEENDRRKIIGLLCRLCAESQSCIVKIFFASRPISQFNHEVKMDHHVIRLQDENEKDISEFARSFLGPDLDLPPEILNQATEYIIEMAQGVFVWVYLVKEQLLKYAEMGCTKRQIFNFLRSLPTELDAFYRDILRKLEKREEPDIKDGLRMFRFVLFTYRPLRLAELRHALAIPDDPDAEFLTSDESFEGDLIYSINKRVVHCGGNLLEIKGLDEYRSVQFMHHTVREFFLWYNKPATELEFQTRFRMSDGDSHIRISITCFRYLMLCAANTSLEMVPPSVNDDWTPEQYEAYAEYLNNRPFINYALSHLTQHIERCRQHANFEQLVSLLCEQLSNNLACLLLESWVESHLHQNIATPEKGFAKDFRIKLLHAATRMKYSHVVEAVLTTGADKEACLHDKTPLMVSAESGDEATARVLLDQEACLGAKDKNKQTALHFATAKAHDQMIKLLFHRGADKEAKDGEGRTPLHYAASNGHNTTLQMLIETLSVNKEAKDDYGRTALHHAASNGHDTTLRILIETLSVDKEATEGEGRMALHHGASNGHDTLLEKGAYVGARYDDGRNPLHQAAVAGSEEVVRLLLNKNQTAAINTTDNNRCTPLDLAIMFGHENAAVLLSNMYNKENDPQKLIPFGMAILFGRTRMVKFWVAGVDKKVVESTIKFANKLAADKEDNKDFLEDLDFINKDFKNIDLKRFIHEDYPNDIQEIIISLEAALREKEAVVDEAAELITLQVNETPVDEASEIIASQRNEMAGDQAQ